MVKMHLSGLLSPKSCGQACLCATYQLGSTLRPPSRRDNDVSDMVRLDEPWHQLNLAFYLLSGPMTRGPISLTILSPFSVKGMSLTPVCRPAWLGIVRHYVFNTSPFRLHSVSPCRTR